MQRCYDFLLLLDVLLFPDGSLALESFPMSSLSLLLDLNPRPGLGLLGNIATSVLSSPATRLSTPAIPRGLLSAPTLAATEVFGLRLATVGEAGAGSSGRVSIEWPSDSNGSMAKFEPGALTGSGPNIFVGEVGYARDFP